jgi:hypothetical protein
LITSVELLDFRFYCGGSPLAIVLVDGVSSLYTKDGLVSLRRNVPSSSSVYRQITGIIERFDTLLLSELDDLNVDDLSGQSSLF